MRPPGCAFYSPIAHGVTLNLEETIKGDYWNAPCSTWFHEFGHDIDALAAHSGMHISHEGGLGDSVRNEVKGLITSRHSALKAAFRQAADAMDYGAMRNVIDQYFSGGSIGAARMREFLYSDVSALESREFTNSAEIRKSPRYRSLTSVRRARDSMWAEFVQIPDIARSDLSDMVDGATNHGIQAGYGHPGTYWDYPEHLSTEVFAEMTSASLTNPDSLNIIKKYLPKSYEKYLEIVEGLL